MISRATVTGKVLHLETRQTSGGKDYIHMIVKGEDVYDFATKQKEPTNVSVTLFGKVAEQCNAQEGDTISAIAVVYAKETRDGKLYNEIRWDQCVVINFSREARNETPAPKQQQYSKPKQSTTDDFDPFADE